jgi:ribosomal protein S18 acetylase RimI-like enzyme
MSEVTVRLMRPEDAPFLRHMLALASRWELDPDAVDVEGALTSRALQPYVEGLGSDRDTGVIAEVDRTPVGAAWFRTFDPSRPGYGFVDAVIPEVTIAVLGHHRGRGIGRDLLRALVRIASACGVPALSLSVAAANPARALYRSEGFDDVALVEGSWTMVREVPSS